jgi:hypothetical protein
MYRKDIILRMGAVESEYRASALAVADLLSRLESDPTVLRGASLTQADVRSCHQNLERTYLVRLFAVFEEALREVRQVVYGKSGPIKMEPLLQQCAARQHIRDDDLNHAHRVREFRNMIVHVAVRLPR